ncbi:hypothetical protein Tco_1031781 [Tanacetum coccineum]|uniref:Uncharacterized protein n=1 Tax=Tanacetum coccineum TaxID=301880 RepID=A0ABQ5GBG4_9ASTR
MDMYTKLSERVLDLEHTKTAQAKEIINLKLRVKKLEKKAGLRTHKFKRLYKGRSIEDIDKDADVSLVDETQGRSDDAEIFDTDERLARKKKRKPTYLIESCDKKQAMIEADFELAQRLQIEEQGEITIEERSRLFVNLINKRKKHFAKLRAEEKRSKPPTKAQK